MTSPLAALDDRSLITLALTGDPEYFSALMDRHLVIVRKRIFWMLRNECDSEDLVQEIVLKVWVHLSKFRGESSFRTWMTRVAVNEVLQFCRRRKRRPEQGLSDDLSWIASSIDSPYEVLSRARAVGTVRNAVMNLPSMYKWVLILHDLEELSIRETAHRLQSTVPAVKTQVFRARRMLLAALQ